MTEKDMTEKALEAYNDVFADIVNALIYKGEQVVKPDELERGRERTLYTGEKAIRDQERDTSKYWRKNEIRIAYFGLENETELEDGFPFRVIGYDGAAYRDQIKYKKDARGKPFVSDYKINLFEIAYLSDEQLSYFKSDFWCVARLIRQN